MQLLKVSLKLPNRFFYPNKLLGHAFKLLANGGEMLIINQGQFEAKEQERLLKELQIPYKYKGKVMSSYYEYKNERYGFLIKTM